MAGEGFLGDMHQGDGFDHRVRAPGEPDDSVSHLPHGGDPIERFL
jgi:hypothetical protein